MAELEFAGDIALIQEAISETPAFVAQREATLATLSPSSGNRILDVGCGTGHMLLELARAVGPTGRVTGLDANEDMLNLARRRCRDVAEIDFRTGDLYELPFSDGSFDEAISVQVFEYLADVPAALAEVHRILRPGGRVLIRDADWGAQLWRCTDQARMRHIMEVWDRHLADPHLPQTLAPRLSGAGFAIEVVHAITTVETECSEKSMNHHLMKFIIPFVISEGVSAEEAEAWHADLLEHHDDGDYFYSFTGYAFLARRK